MATVPWCGSACHSGNVKEEKEAWIYSLFLLASVDVAAQAAGAPVAASLAYDMIYFFKSNLYHL